MIHVLNEALENGTPDVSIGNILERLETRTAVGKTYGKPIEKLRRAHEEVQFA